MKKVAFILTILGFVLLRPYQLQTSGLLYSDDDDDYFAHASAIVFGEFPDYSKEYFNKKIGNVGQVPLGSIGTGILASPFVFAFSLLDRIAGEPIVQARTRQNIVRSWSAFGFVVGTQIYFWLSLLMLYWLLRRFTSDETAVIIVVLMMLVQGLPLYLYRRPVFSHIYELFLQTSLVTACGFRDRFFKNRIPILLIGVLSGLIALTRVNNVHFALLAPFLFFGLDASLRGRQKAVRIALSLLVAGLVGIIFKLIPLVLAGTGEPYGPSAQRLLDQGIDVVFLFRRAFYILFGIDWGLVYTAPFCVMGFGAVVWLIYKKMEFPLKIETLVLSGALFLNLFLIAQWGTQGAWYGYRLFLFSAIPVLSLPLAWWLESLKRIPPRRRRIAYGILAAFSIQPLLSMLVFDGNSTNLTLHPIGGGWGWANLTYQLEIWKTLLMSPMEIGIALLKGGPLYMGYLMAQILGATERLPGIVFEKYSYFSWLTVAKSSFLISVPFLALAASVRKVKENRKCQD